MSLAAGSRGHSPMSSGCSSPQPRRRIDEDTTKKDPKYKRFSASIDKALALFETNSLQEWADYISFLARLLRALQQHPSLPLIPSKYLVAQRLAQCLNPRLPSGVHQKTIEVYSYIFSLIGCDGLASDLPLWTPGLAPVLSYASLNLKPHYLDLLERFYLPLGREVRPALKALILALLPGIDEEGGEYFDRTMELLDSFWKGVGDDAYFWQCVMLATITSPGRRQGALAYLVRRLPKLGTGRASSTEEGNTGLDGKTEEERRLELEALMNPEPGLLIRALCAGLGDEQLLVQRGFLDLLTTNTPLSSPIIQERVTKSDLQMLVTCAAGVVLRKDMGLNRRLWSWYLGPEDLKATEYFRRYGAQALVGGLLEMLDHQSDTAPSERARPYRICLSIMDRWEVGSQVVSNIFSAAIESLRSYEKSAPSRNYTEVFKSASSFFDGVEARLIWKLILDKINNAMNGTQPECIEHLESVRFIIRTFNVREEEMVLVHAPNIFLATLLQLAGERTGAYEDDMRLRKEAYMLADDIWELVPGAAFHRKVSSTNDSDDSETSFLNSIRLFYSKNQEPSTDGALSAGPLLPHHIAECIFSEIVSSVRYGLENGTKDMSNRCGLFVKIIHKLSKLNDRPIIDSIVASFIGKLSQVPAQFVSIQGIGSVVTALLEKGYLTNQDTDSLVVLLVTRLWHFFSPDSPKYHVEGVKVLWNLQNVLKDRRIEAAVSTVITDEDISGTYSFRGADQGRKFAVLWKHSIGKIGGSEYHMVLTRPLFLVLDALADDNVEMSVFARGWLQNLSSINKVFWIIVTKLLHCDFLKDAGERDSHGAPLRRPVYHENDCLEIASYYFQTLLNILRYATQSVLDALASELVIGMDDSRRKILQERGYGEDDMTLQMFFARAALRAVDGDRGQFSEDYGPLDRVSQLHRVALSVLHQLLSSPYSKSLADMALEDIIATRLTSMNTDVVFMDTFIQVSLLDVLHAAFKISVDRPTSYLGQLRNHSREIAFKGALRMSISGDPEKAAPPPQFAPPQKLLKCLLAGFSNLSSRPVLDSWIFFLGECLPLVSDVIFQMLIPLVECLCEQIRLTFESLKIVFKDPSKLSIPEAGGRSPESTLVALLNGLEQILAAAHEQLLAEELKTTGPKSPDTSSAGFFGNMVSGVFSVEGPQSRSAAANNRLTVLLCFQDTVKICHSIWSWADIYNISTELDFSSRESWQYTGLRIKGRARRILEHMFAAETLECLETLIELWPGRLAPYGERNVGSIFKLVNVLDGSRPKHTIPAVFNAIYSRANPAALEPARRSTLTAELTDMDVVIFLVEYARSLEDDAMDEIWGDCMVFLRDVLANPFPHRQTLPSLLSFTATIGEKVDNTNFGEQKKTRRELADLFQRMLTAAFTVTPMGQGPRPIDSVSVGAEVKADRPAKGRTVSDNIVQILVSIVPELRTVLLEADRVLAASTNISSSLIGPTFRAKAFPQNVSASLLQLLFQLTRLQNNQKAWKKDLADALNDPKFFMSPVKLVEDHWVPLARQHLINDREKMTELLTRLTPPTTAGVLFGVGAASARLEADRRTQLNLKRIVFLIYAGDHDAFVVNLEELEEKLVELLAATSISSPSSATRGEIYMVFRALALRTSAIHLASLWPIINSELRSALIALFPEGDVEKTFTDHTILHACKLLDTLLVIAPDEFQLHEWLFVTDTIEAVYHPHDWNPTALVDQVAMDMAMPGNSVERSGNGRKPWYVGREEKDGVNVKAEAIAPFLRNLSIACYEGTYNMGRADVRACEVGLVRDLFEEGSES